MNNYNNYRFNNILIPIIKIVGEELSYIGGKHTKAMVKRIMSKLFKDELLQNYSFTGKKGKTPFFSLAICSVILSKFIFLYKHIFFNVLLGTNYR